MAYQPFMVIQYQTQLIYIYIYIHIYIYIYSHPQTDCFVLLKCPQVQIAFFKLTSCDNQVLVGCIPIPVVAVHLNLKSYKLVSHLIRCIAITY